MCASRLTSFPFYLTLFLAHTNPLKALRFMVRNDRGILVVAAFLKYYTPPLPLMLISFSLSVAADRHFLDPGLLLSVWSLARQANHESSPFNHALASKWAESFLVMCGCKLSSACVLVHRWYLYRTHKTTELLRSKCTSDVQTETHSRGATLCQCKDKSKDVSSNSN